MIPVGAPRRVSMNWSTATSQPTIPIRRTRLPYKGRPRRPSARRVEGPGIPSATRPFRCWKCRTAAAVIGPAIPSIAPWYSPQERSATWSPACCGFTLEPAREASAAGAAAKRTAREHAAAMTIRAGMDGPTWGPGGELLPRRATSYDPFTEVSVGKRLFFIGLIASLSATALIAIVTLLVGDFDETGGRILLTTALLSGFSLFALPAGALLDRGRGVWLAYAVLALSALAFVVAMTLVWGSWDDGGGDHLWKSLAVL